MGSYYFQENEIGLAKWHSYSYWSCHQQYSDWQTYWSGYHKLCNRYHWNLKWEWMLKYHQRSIGVDHWGQWNWNQMTWIWYMETGKSVSSTWWLLLNYVSALSVKVGNLGESQVVVLPSRTQKMTVLKSPHADKKSREQFSKKKWSMVWKMYTEARFGYMTCTQAVQM